MSLYDSLLKEDKKKIVFLLKEAESNNGLVPLDVERFWAEQDESFKEPFSSQTHQVALGVFPTGDCVFDELGIEEDFYRYANDSEWVLELNKKYNDISEKIIGRRFLSEKPFELDKIYPDIKKLHHFFESENVWEGGKGGSWWLKQSVNNEDELKALLDRIDNLDIKKFILPDNWYQEKERLMALGIKPPLYRHQRGPCTFACSIYGAENTLFLCMDNPELAVRFSKTILRVILEIAKIIDEEAGYNEQTKPNGWGWLDDNCCLFNPQMYELFGYPILKGIFDYYSPNLGDLRYQHSDSNMAHLRPQLGKLGLTRVNFGPTLSVSEIRQYLPNAIIDGQLAPFTLMRNDGREILAEFFRDFNQSKRKKGLVFSTAGSINNGSKLTSIRLIMSAIQKFGWYE